MPTQTAIRHAAADQRAGKKPSTQAGEFVREEMRSLQHGSKTVRSRKQAIAIGLSQARRSGVKVGAPNAGSATVRRKAKQDSAIGLGRAKVSPARSAGARKAARTRAREAT
jgi:hypothetical protein